MKTGWRSGSCVPGGIMSLRRVAVPVIVFAVAVSLPAPAAEAATMICNRFCDGRSASLAPADRQAVSSTLYGRRFTVHVNDTDAMVWASLDSGRAGDEVWLDRSFDGGRTWVDSRLGAGVVAVGATSRRTAQFNVDNWAANGVGALRACGKAGDRPELTCTAWARSTWNAWDRRTAAATALMMQYNLGTGLFGNNDWWT